MSGLAIATVIEGVVGGLMVSLVPDRSPRLQPRGGCRDLKVMEDRLWEQGSTLRESVGRSRTPSMTHSEYGSICSSSEQGTVHALADLVCALLVAAFKVAATHLPSEDQRRPPSSRLDPRTDEDAGRDPATGDGLSEGRPGPERT